MSAEDSSTPYVKIEPEKWRGFGDIPMRNIPSESDASQGETEHLNPDTTVSTVDEDSMYHFDLESCFVSFSIPCHVIGKVGIRIGVGYPSLFFLYGFFFTVFNFCYYVFAFGVKPLCDTSNRIQLCSFTMDKKTCTSSYMEVNHNFYVCEYSDTYKTCYGSKQTCIKQTEFTILWSSWCFLEVLTLTALTLIHLFVRRNIKERMKMTQDTLCKDVLYVLFCNTCSLAQQYRLLEKEDNMNIHV
jgi:hypothetical protein